jgi:hypothetical protein
MNFCSYVLMSKEKIQKEQQRKTYIVVVNFAMFG